MKETIKASADWYFEGPGWIIMCFLSIMISSVATGRSPHRKMRLFFLVAFVAGMPITLLLLSHYIR